ncbi:MAG: DUF4129 domain-containing protein [Saprospiraceae bacterium]|nr:DUF4129 domain-containing protein [Saprospiraceae bacterium]MDW8230345.1 DUF4129 domain-containing protein [Saprospiraceae bacterium]
MLFRLWTGLLFFFLLVGLSLTFGQTDAPPVRPIPPETWEKALKRLDYSGDIPPPERKPPSPPAAKMPEPPKMEWLSDAVAIGLIGILLAGAAWLAYWLLLSARNRPLNEDDQAAEDTENLERRLHDSDLPALLQQALARGDYRQATRVHFLMIIRHLSEKGDILWSQEKTNRQYVRDMRKHPKASDFQRAVLLYEHAWYGGAPIGRTDYERQIGPLFDSLLARSR